MLADIVAGNNLKEGIDREVGNIRQNAALSIQKLTNTNKHYESDDESEIETKQKKNKVKTKKKNQLKKKGGDAYKILKVWSSCAEFLFHFLQDKINVIAFLIR